MLVAFRSSIMPASFIAMSSHLASPKVKADRRVMDKRSVSSQQPLARMNFRDAGS